MSYQIEYKPIQNPQISSDRHFLRPILLSVAVFVAFSMVVNSCWPRGREILQDFLLPGDPKTTLAALDAFAEEMRCGESFSAAAEVFCREILTDADIP